MGRRLTRCRPWVGSSPLKGSSPLEPVGRHAGTLVPRSPGPTPERWRVGETFDPLSAVPHAAVGRGLLPRGAPLACGPAERPPSCMFHVLLLLALRRRDLRRLRVVRQRRRVARRPPRGRTRRRGHHPGRRRHRAARERRDPGRGAVRQPEHGNDIAVGAAMGGPLVVGTIAYGVTGGMLIWRKRRLRAGPHRGRVPAWRRAAGRTAAARSPRRPATAVTTRPAATRPVTTWPASTPRGWPATRRGSSRSSRSRSGSAWSPSPSSRGWARCSSRSTPCTSGARCAPAASRPRTRAWSR